jgi:shikimate dehydrogenase
LTYAAVLGHPVSHSLSPALHTAAYRALGMTDWTYTAIDCAESELAGRLAGAGSDCAGFAVTMPLKRAALSLARQRSDTAAATGATNTLLPDDGGWVAHNTDVAGIVGALAEREIDPATGTVVLLGAGGAAQAAVVALGTLGVRRVTLLVRSPDRAEDVRATAVRADVALDVVALEPRALAGVDLVVSALPAGAANPIVPAAVTGAQCLLDMVYAPWPTRLAASYLAAGARIASGHDMLLHQATAQFELMTGRPAPVDVMRAALAAGLAVAPKPERAAGSAPPRLEDSPPC